MRVIDCHVHLNDYQINKYSNLEDRLEKLQQYMDEYGVEISIILSSYIASNQRPSVQELLQQTRKYQNLRLVGGFSIDNHTEEDFQNYKRWLRENALIGIKIYCGYEPHFPSDQRYQKIYDLCVELKVPVMMHCGDTFSNNAKLKYAHPLNVDEVATDNPDLKIIICHLGNPWILDCQEVLYKNQNVYADISGLFFGPTTEYYEKKIIERIKELLSYTSSPHHLLFGTDWPISDVGTSFKLVDKLLLTDQDRNLLMYGNAIKFFNL
jgi:predicted TIM-barrel fold metal-dependent hydrolase